MSSYVNLVIGISSFHIDKIISERTWYTRVTEELVPIKNQIRLIFFYTSYEIDKNKTERQIIGCFAYPKYAGNAVRDPIEKKFILSEDGNYIAITSDEDFVISPLLYVKLPYLPSKIGERIWRINDEDALSVLKSLYEAHLRFENTNTQYILNVLELLIDEFETEQEKSIPIAPEIETELSLLPDWLKDELQQCDINDLPHTPGIVKSLLGRSIKNSIYNLQAAAIQIKLGDYKFILSLANYCYSKAYIALKDSDYKKAAQLFLEAANLYHRDPMITGTGWKQQKRLECIVKYIEVHVQDALEKHSYNLGYHETESEITTRLNQIRKYISYSEIQNRIRIAYYTLQGWYLCRTDSERFLEFFSNMELELQDQLPGELLAIFYDLMTDKSVKNKKGACREDFIQAASYKFQALQIYKSLYEDGQSNHAKAGYLARSVDYHKYNALAASCDNDLENFKKSIDVAIKFAEELNQNFPKEIHETNIHFLKGMKYDELSRHSENVSEKVELHAKARDEYFLDNSYESQKRYVFHQLLYYFYKLRHLIGKTNHDFEVTRLLSIEALQADWAKPSGEQYLPDYISEEHRGLHLSVATFGNNIDFEDLGKLHEAIQIMEARGVKSSIRKIARLVYGIQLIRACGIDDDRIIGETVKAIRSAIRQLLESNTISADEIYDELQMEKERIVEEEVEQEILSKLRRRKLEEDFSVEAKEYLCDPNTARFNKSIYETMIAFLNSPNGGHIFIGVEDDTYSPVGIQTDLDKYEGSRDKLKQALQNHIQDKLPRTLHEYLPSISISFPEVEGKILMWVKIPPGTYDKGLYVDVDGIAYIRKDGRLERIFDPVQKDELAKQKREGQGIWRV